MCYMLIDYPGRQWLVYEYITGAYLTYHAQVSKARQVSPLYLGRGASPRERSGRLLCVLVLLREVGRLWGIYTEAFRPPGKTIGGDRVTPVAAG